MGISRAGLTTADVPTITMVWQRFISSTHLLSVAPSRSWSNAIVFSRSRPLQSLHRGATSSSWGSPSRSSSEQGQILLHSTHLASLMLPCSSITFLLCSLVKHVHVLRDDCDVLFTTCLKLCDRSVGCIGCSVGKLLQEPAMHVPSRTCVFTES